MGGHLGGLHSKGGEDKMDGRIRLSVCPVIIAAFALEAAPAWMYDADDDCRLVLLKKKSTWAETYAYDVNEAGRIAGAWQTF